MTSRCDKELHADVFRSGQVTDEDTERPVRAGVRDNLAASSRANHGVSIERTASVVMIKLTCVDEYGAIELYEHLIASIKKGSLKLELAATGLQ
jgi:hypothetical protein